MASLRLCGAAARIPAAQVVVDTHHRRSFQLLKLGPNQLPSNLSGGLMEQVSNLVHRHLDKLIMITCLPEFWTAWKGAYYDLVQERLQIRQVLFTALASNSNPSGAEPVGDSVQDKTSDAPQDSRFFATSDKSFGRYAAVDLFLF
ncbi:hypothetical protein EZV62_017059 [Acer yangbiense]|uniref:Uncharacterized protein n=1 Tax=Acer yangbiense TaxID=1000413 RepID=A0A5C7HHQ0_9ROSI|nr:hypothetical protein EZV62_017059 [Acer yangbiense]